MYIGLCVRVYTYLEAIPYSMFHIHIISWMYNNIV